VIRIGMIGLIFYFVSNVFSLSTQKATVHPAIQVATENAWNEARIGEVYAIVSDPHDPTTFYAATNGRGIFKSTDGGGTWKNICKGMPFGVAPKKVVVDPLDPNVIYTEGDTALFKSTDGGASWVSATSGLGEGPFYGLAINPSDPSILYVGSGHKIFQTSNGGQSWRVITPELENGQFALVVDPKTPQVIYSLSDGLSKSSDAGANWTSIDSNLPKKELNTISLAPWNSSVLYVGTEKHGIYKSTDGGKSWSALNSGLKTKNQNEPDGEIPPVRAIAIDPSNPNILYAGVAANVTAGPFAAVFKSTNAGENWKLLSVIGSGKGRTTVNCLAVDPFAPNVVFAGTDGDGIFKSVDGGVNWSGEDSELSTGSVVALSIGKKDGTLYAGTLEGIFKFEGLRWRQIGFSHRDFGGEWIASLAVDPSNSATVYVGTRSSYVSKEGGLFKSTDGGRSWLAADSGLRHFAGWISALAIDPSNPGILYAGTYGYGVFKTTNAGIKWVPSSSGIVRSEYSVAALAIDPNDSSMIYAVTSAFVWKSTNRGLHWSHGNGLPSSPDPAWRSRLTTITINPLNSSIMYAGHFYLGPKAGTSGTTIYESTDAGANWFSAGKASEKVIDCLEIDPSDPTRLYADNGDSGILKSVDNGRSWTAMNSGLPRPIKPPVGFQSSTLVSGLAVDPILTSTVYISTAGRGVFKSADGGLNWTPIPTY
jgi:photosystem II stability/assembly factor-like uncharacterized protein